MNLRAFAASASGRVANITLGTAIVGAGVLALVGPGPHIHAAIPMVIMLCGVGAISTICLAVNVHWSEALLLVMTLPLLSGPYAIGLFLVAKAGSSIGGALVVLGLVPLWIAAGGYRVYAPKSSASMGNAQPA